MVLCGKCKCHHPTPADVRRCYQAGTLSSARAAQRTTTHPTAKPTRRSVTGGVAIRKARPARRTPRRPAGGNQGARTAAVERSQWVGGGHFRTPPNAEAWVGYECEQCGAKVPGGAAYDC